jgi:hypothetical protein
MFTPGQPPQDLAGLVRYVGTEFRRLAESLAGNQDSIRLKPLYAEPTRMYPCMLVYADGTTWNPGSGEGVYRRNLANSAWVFVG